MVGELEERIRELVGFRDYKYNYPCAFTETMFRAMLERFEEMWSEFPDYDKIMDMEGEEFDGEEYNEMHEGYFIDKVYEWHKKWSGKDE